WALVVGGALTLFGLIILTSFAYSTASASRNLSLAIGALFGSALLLGIQMLFELQGSKTSESVETEFTFDLEKPALRQWQYPVSLGERFASELRASQYLSSTHSEKLARSPADRERLVSDMSIFSLVAYITTKQHDWQTQRRHINVEGTLTEILHYP